MSFVLKLAGAVERAIIRTGEAVAWLTFVMTIVTCLVAVLRYGLSLGWIWLQETITWMHAAVFLLAAGYTLARDEHVRVDIFYREMSPKRQAVVNLSGCLLFLLPLTAGLVLGSLDYVETSWRIHESSREAGGLIYPFPSLLKTLLPLTGVLVGLQSLVICLRSSAVLLGIPLEDGSDPATGSQAPGSTAGGGV
ncbi:MAG: TRAP transporter small permease subunit [Gammaproteobacteria bacterium]|nr:TRAP transporter small permease subunit [Gammaproteobacteria bacterium]MXW45512.1 TRAP transporter small permease subunit [Gammaproteobacteria bacterium]MYD01508.1 TRAP transporter small permease subunit [Gammaproteobacteria bacterium]MYI26124.1 TRAP transporter small permease subunit [Gammaproteobacteria bacterium]